MFVNKKKRRLERALELEKKHFQKTKRSLKKAVRAKNGHRIFDMEFKLMHHEYNVGVLEKRIKSCRGPRLHGLP